jgi:hypothetical protein
MKRQHSSLDEERKWKQLGQKKQSATELGKEEKKTAAYLSTFISSTQMIYYEQRRRENLQ